ncbi:MAG: ABC transporter permease [Xanthomonadales bacterium]|nr:ABC transporter permease [Xanthomonadales bacterium]
MIRAIFLVSWMNLGRDRTALVLTFLLPIVFFSIFAAVFGDLDEAGAQTIDIALVNPSRGEISAQMMERLAEQGELQVVLRTGPGDENGREQALQAVLAGIAGAAIVLPEDFDDVIDAGETARVELLADTSNPIAVRAISGLLNAATLEAGYLLAEEEFESQPEAGPLDIVVVDAIGRGEKRPSIAYFAAGLGVLFLLFSMSNRSAQFIDEQETGVLERLLTSRLGINRLLFGRWLFLLTLGVLQVTVMFIWAALAFGLPLWTAGHLAGFAVITLATAAAAAAFGMILALLCRSREQLVATSMVVVLILAALGGNLFPRFLMPEQMQTLGRITFNAWALDGYQKVFWYDSPVSGLTPELAVLAGTTVVFLLIARLLARRWERV